MGFVNWILESRQEINDIFPKNFTPEQYRVNIVQKIGEIEENICENVIENLGKEC